MGGIEKHIAELSKVLIKEGHNVTVITTKFEANLTSSEEIAGVDVVRFKQPKIKYFGLIYTWLWFIWNKNLIKKSDLIHVHDVFIWYWPFKFIYPNKKVFVTNHGQWGKYPINPADLIQKKLSRKYSDGVISIGRYIDIYYGIKSDLISYGAAKLVHTNQKEKTILYVGRLDNNTGLSIFLQMLNKNYENKILNKYKIVFCGDGELREECEKYGEVLGWTDPAKYYKKAEFVFASGYLTILESVANKCLVFTAFGNKLQKDYYQLTPFADFINIAKNEEILWHDLKFFALDQNEAKKVVEMGYNWVKDQSWKNLANQYISLWKINQK